ncbi:helix-turn-helix domain-containing protein [Candidatus Poriferisocius sp.]|uniref:helix-turn-helix domain-containing protein n=1 Tax=Candidatus Poriferisocius sp. TaxID=3101276 RepID=UPI003B0196BD
MSEVARQAYEDEALVATFRGLVYRVRTEAGLSQRQLATKMGIAKSAVEEMEDGGTQPTPELVANLGAAVGQKLDWDVTFGPSRLLDPLNLLGPSS